MAEGSFQQSDDLDTFAKSFQQVVSEFNFFNTLNTNQFFKLILSKK